MWCACEIVSVLRVVGELCGTEAAVRRPISSEEKFVLCVFTLWEWLIGVPVERVVVCDKLCFRVYVI